MTMTDPIADLLTRIRNASSARHERAEIPWSRVKEQICRVLVSEGYIREVSVAEDGPGKKITLVLAYTEAGAPVISGISRESRPSLRVYSGAADAPRVRLGLGVSILSTPAGLLVDREARRRNVGGEVICKVW
ncbi:MAG: 30S ribosomal protein S8 [Deltaproteobacteria bacterium]|jgi:small subunit ribosomal protein S8